MLKDYTYAVTRIRGRELYLLNQAAVEQLISCKTYEEALSFLEDKGWGSPGEKQSAETILEAETQKIWSLMRELVEDISVFDVFRIENDFHNMKAAIKLEYTQSGIHPSRLFVKGGTVDPELIWQAARERDFSILPERMAAGQEAQNVLLHTGDGQLCDIILDKASLEATYSEGKKSDSEVIREYAVLHVIAADIKIAVRCGRLGKPLDFIRRALAECEELDTAELSKAAMGGSEGVAEYLSGTDYQAAAEALLISPTELERWCDNLIIEHMKPQKYNPFTIGPLAAYILARLNEIKCVRMILSSKLNGWKEEIIRERLREMYV